MGTIDDVAEKIKGKTQQLNGNVEQHTGHEEHGLWEKTKGKVNETVADIMLDRNHPVHRIN